jgi:hypothetical protein
VADNNLPYGDVQFLIAVQASRKTAELHFKMGGEGTARGPKVGPVTDGMPAASVTAALAIFIEGPKVGPDSESMPFSSTLNAAAKLPMLRCARLSRYKTLQSVSATMPAAHEGNVLLQTQVQHRTALNDAKDCAAPSLTSGGCALQASAAYRL